MNEISQASSQSNSPDSVSFLFPILLSRVDSRLDAPPHNNELIQHKPKKKRKRK